MVKLFHVKSRARLENGQHRASSAPQTHKLKSGVPLYTYDHYPLKHLINIAISLPSPSPHASPIPSPGPLIIPSCCYFTNTE